MEEAGIDKKTETQNKVLLACVGLFIIHLETAAVTADVNYVPDYVDPITDRKSRVIGKRLPSVPNFCLKSRYFSVSAGTVQPSA
jgi:hypothetical protein